MNPNENSPDERPDREQVQGSDWPQRDEVLDSDDPLGEVTPDDDDGLPDGPAKYRVPS